MNENKKVDVIVVGGGPAGISAAITIARGGKKVVLIERGKFSGSKNVFGGAVYTRPTKEIFPDFETTAPLERRNVEHKFTILTEEESTVISYKNKKSLGGSYTVIRAKFDRWMAQEAKKEGVYLVEETVVRELLQVGSKVVGVKTELEDYYADIVILADGVNSLLAKSIGLRNEIETKDVALSVKEVIKLNKEKINDRFHVYEDEGCIYELFGGPMLGMLGLGFVYTNKESVSIGYGLTLSELVAHEIKPYDMLDKLKAHPTIAPLIKDGETIEYSAHLIPEGGYKKIPKLYADGVMIVGDAAMLVNNLHWEGTNLAMISGKLAGETAIRAIDKNDFSSSQLSIYQKKLENSFVLKDLKTYKDLMDIMHVRKDSFLNYYLKKINAFFEMFTSVDSVPKRKKYWDFIKSIFTERKIGELFRDVVSVFKLLWGILK